MTHCHKLSALLYPQVIKLETEEAIPEYRVFIENESKNSWEQ